MPKRDDIKRVMIIRSGPIIIGQACVNRDIGYRILDPGWQGSGVAGHPYPVSGFQDRVSCNSNQSR